MAIVTRDGIQYGYKALNDGVHGVNYRERPRQRMQQPLLVNSMVTVKQVSGGGPDNDKRVSLGDTDTPAFLQEKIELLCNGVPLTQNFTGPIGNQKLSYEISSCYPPAPDAYRIQDEGVLLPTRSALNFIGGCVEATDDPANDRTNVTFTCASGGGTDRLVSVSPSDTTPGLLSTKLRTCPGTNRLSLTVQNVGGNEYYELCGDANLIPNIDQRVAVSNGCTPNFLNDVTEAGQGLIKSTPSCRLNYALDANWTGWIAPAAKMVLNNTVSFNTTVDPAVDILRGFSFEYAYTGMGVSPNRFTVTKSGYYSYGFTGIINISKSINSIRMYMGMPLLDNSRSRIDLDIGPGDLVSPLVNSSTNNGSLFTAHAAMFYTGHTTSWLNAGEVVQVEYRISANVDPSIPGYNTDPIAVFIGKDGLSPSTPGDTQTGFTAWIKYETDLQFRVASFA